MDNYISYKMFSIADYLRFKSDRNHIERIIIDCNQKIYRNYWSNNPELVNHWIDMRNNWIEDILILDQKIKIFERTNRIKTNYLYLH